MNPLPSSRSARNPPPKHDDCSRNNTRHLSGDSAGAALEHGWRCVKQQLCRDLPGDGAGASLKRQPADGHAAGFRHLPGECAGASLKWRGFSGGQRDRIAHLPGECAGASLKPALDQVQDSVELLNLPGGCAGASLKRCRPIASDAAGCKLPGECAGASLKLIERPFPGRGEALSPRRVYRGLIEASKAPRICRSRKPYLPRQLCRGLFEMPEQLCAASAYQGRIEYNRGLR